MTSSSPPTIPTIAVLGSLNVDLVTRTPRVPAAGETIIANGFSTGHGGKGANQAVACARLSRTRTRPSSTPPDVFVRMIGAVGDDHFGAEFLRALKDDGLDVEGVRVVAGERTGTAVIVVEEESGENRIMVSTGANWRVEPKPLVPEGTAVVVLQLEVPMEVVEVNVRDAKRRGVDVVINPAPAVPLSDEVYQGLGHLIVNESEAALLSGRPAEEITPDADLTAVAANFVRRGVRNVIITLGSAGCFYHTSALHAEGLPGKIVPARKVKVVDTTAAGDTFAGAYAVAVAKSRAQGPFDIDAAIAFANRAAAQTVQRKGAQSAIPWLDEVPEA
ncbi:Ribokinase-like protein [Macrophomina phaseolina]|uniref:Ribokinase n=1 Tax=Macrophomina phaseolina TaxID=35725 RepID=A0ABQ8G264_9PEZI|nr:Ribokinase-like protein [Macrophomina phaseolina]